MRVLLSILLFQLVACSSTSPNRELERYRQRADRVTIIRDIWGIPHVYGKTDADAVFGLMYAQCEDNFEKVEKAYLKQLGRMAEVEGAGWLYEDLKARLLFDTAAAQEDYQKSPAWLKELLQAFADGINYYLYKHPETKPFRLTRFEPWYPLLHTDGAYIATQTGGFLPEYFRALYARAEDKNNSGRIRFNTGETGLAGSNGFAIAPARSATGNALLYINPHVSFYFRMEAHMVSEEGLNAYGAVTWGQFFVFQGFNEHCGWMHTSTAADAADLYEEQVQKKGEGYVYAYEQRERPVVIKNQELHYRENNRQIPRTFTTYYTHHGPVVGSREGKWISLKASNHSLNGLIQSWQRTKATDYASFQSSMQLRANASTNTLYADNKGNIAYWHGNFIPKRDPSLNCADPLDGSMAKTEWQGIHEVNETVHLYNPTEGWIQNCNSTPFTATGNMNVNRNRYPAYMAPEGENFRSLQAIQELKKESRFTLDKLIALGYNHYLSAFDSILPPLLSDYDHLAAADPARVRLKEPITQLSAWDRKSAVTSIPATLAILWGYTILAGQNKTSRENGDQVSFITAVVRNTAPADRLKALVYVVDQLEALYGTWKMPWGEINRYQRLSRESNNFDDAQKSWPVGLASALFGSLAAYESDWFNTKKAYGFAGNSFVAAVEFGKKVKAKSIHTGGQSFSPSSKHFTDQAPQFIEGRFRDVFFYKEDVERNKERRYKPGE